MKKIMDKYTFFRFHYHSLELLKLNRTTAHWINGFPKAKKANACLVYVYADNEKGLLMEVVAAAKIHRFGVVYFDSTNDIRSVIPMERVDDSDLKFIEYKKEEQLRRKYAEKIATVRDYTVSPEIEETRSMGGLDEYRHDSMLDMVLVYLMKEGNRLEGCWARITGLNDRRIKGSLLEEPEQDFGCHIGDPLAFYMERGITGCFCVADLNEKRNSAQENTENKKRLERAFCEAKTTKNSECLRKILRESTVLLPCTAVLGERDRFKFGEFGDHVLNEPVKHEKFVRYDANEVRLVPEILRDGDTYYLPVFTTTEELGEYGMGFSLVKKNMLEVISIARRENVNVDEIIMDAFTEPLVLDKETWNGRYDL